MYKSEKNEKQSKAKRLKFLTGGNEVKIAAA